MVLTDVHFGRRKKSMYMSRRRFELILYNLRYTKDDPPQYKDHFWEVRWMLQEWNKNMGTDFSPSWINCIDKSMSKWVNEFTCPGFMYVPRKPWPFGNDDRIPSTTPGAEPPRDARDSGSARSHSTHLETSSSNRP